MVASYLVILALYVLNGIAFMKLAKLAGRSDISWMAWVPVWNLVQQLLLIKKNGRWVLIYLVPIVNVFFSMRWQVKLLNAFGKSGAYVFLAVFLSPIYAILWLAWATSADTRYSL